uniref:Putative capsid protein n=1 Tax=viral metagenome TaxID=1070528 RepID=A0A6M3L693_9ZZZZ
MAIPSSRSIDYDAVMTLCLEHIRPGLFDSVFSSNAFLSAMYGRYGRKKASGKGIKIVNGGERIRVSLMYEKNSTAKSYSGYDVLDVTPQDGITAAFYQWKQLAVSIAISGLDMTKNKGPTKVRDLLNDKVEQAKMSLYQEINWELMGKTVAGGVWSAGKGMSDGSDLDPLWVFLPKDCSSSVEVGNINQSTYSWWRPRIVDGSSDTLVDNGVQPRSINCTSWARLWAAMRYTYNRCGIGAGGNPDFILTDQLTYEGYEAGLDSRSRINDSTKGPVSVGFDSVRFKGADMVWEEFVPDIDTGVNYDSASWATGTMAFLNTDFMEICVAEGADFVPGPFVKPADQDAKVSQILTTMALTCSNRRKQGLLYGITVPLMA